MSPLRVSSFSSIRVCIHMLWPTMQSVQRQRRKKGKIKMKFSLLLSRDWLAWFASHLVCGLALRGLTPCKYQWESYMWFEIFHDLELICWFGNWFDQNGSLYLAAFSYLQSRSGPIFSCFAIYFWNWVTKILCTDILRIPKLPIFKSYLTGIVAIAVKQVANNTWYGRTHLQYWDKDYSMRLL